MKNILVHKGHDEIDARLTAGFLNSKGIAAILGGASIPHTGVYVAVKDKTKALAHLKTRPKQKTTTKTLRRADHAFAFVVLLAISCLAIVITVNG